MYVVGRNDCVAYVLRKLDLTGFSEEVDQNKIACGCLVENMMKHIDNLPQLKAIILNHKFLKKGDVIFMKGKVSKYVHHIGICVNYNTIDHCIPGQDEGHDWFDYRLFVFGIRLEKK